MGKEVGGEGLTGHGFYLEGTWKLESKEYLPVCLLSLSCWGFFLPIFLSSFFFLAGRKSKGMVRGSVIES